MECRRDLPIREGRGAPVPNSKIGATFIVGDVSFGRCFGDVWDKSRVVREVVKIVIVDHVRFFHHAVKMLFRPRFISSAVGIWDDIVHNHNFCTCLLDGVTSV